jgi:hypothetical protein
VNQGPKLPPIWAKSRNQWPKVQSLRGQFTSTWAALTYQLSAFDSQADIPLPKANVCFVP